MEGIHHHPTTGIFSESTYDADFGGSVTNLAPTIAVDPVPTRRIYDRFHFCQPKLVYSTPEIQHCCWKRTVIKLGKIAKSKLYATSSFCLKAEYVAAAHCCGQWYYWFLLAEQFLLVVFLVSAGSVVPAGLFLTPALTHNPIQATVASMAALKYRDEHNRIGFLEKPKGSTDYHQVIDFLLDSHIRYAIVTDPLIYDSLITQFWSTASLRSSELGPPAIVATIDGTPYTITESLVRSKLQLHDEGGIVDMPIPDIFLGMDKSRGKSTIGLAITLLTEFSWRPYPLWLLHCFHLPKAAMQAGTSGRSTNPQTDHETVTEPVHQTASPHDHGSTSPRPTPTILAAQMNEPVSKPPRPIPTSPSAQVNQQGPSTDPHVESSSKDNDDDPLRGSFFASPSRSTAAPPEDGGNVILSESDNEEDEEQDVDSLIKLAKAAALAADTSSVPADATKATEFPPSSSIHTDAFVHGNDVPTGLGVIVCKETFEENKLNLLEVQEGMKKKRQEIVLNSAEYTMDADWSDIHGISTCEIQELTANLLVSGSWTLKHVRSFSDAQLKDEFDKIRHALDKAQSQRTEENRTLRESLKRQGADLEQPDSKKYKSTEPQKISVPAASRPSYAGVTSDVHQSPFVDTPPTTPPHSPRASSHPDVTPDTSTQPFVAPTPSFATPGPRTRSQSYCCSWYQMTYSRGGQRKSLGNKERCHHLKWNLTALDTSFLHVSI
ncbi:hypothetical protein Tco_0013113 [Tanacetum coccineum]